MSASFCCDRCGSAILGNRSVLQATRGKLATLIVGGETALAEGVDLCEPCAAGFLRWLRVAEVALLAEVRGKDLGAGAGQP